MNKAQKIISRGFGVLVLIGIMLFAYFRFQAYLQGPKITSINIDSYTYVSEPSFSLKGSIDHTQKVLINGRNILLDKGRSFEELISFNNGLNTITIDLEDPFSKKKRYTYYIYYKKTEPTEIPKTLQAAQEKQKDISEKISNTNE